MVEMKENGGKWGKITEKFARRARRADVLFVAQWSPSRSPPLTKNMWRCLQAKLTVVWLIR